MLLKSSYNQKQKHLWLQQSIHVHYLMEPIPTNYQRHRDEKASCNQFSCIYHAVSSGTSLHACGSATDLVLAKCVEHGASLVSCPCCYGGVTTSLGVLTYPRSQVSAASGCTVSVLPFGVNDNKAFSFSWP